MWYYTKFNYNAVKSDYFKEKNNKAQCINLLKNSKYFCFKYKTIEGCTLRTPPSTKDNYYLPYLQIGKNHILNNDSYNYYI